MSEEWRIEHRNHLLSVDGCPYCLKRAAMDEEPVKIGTWCMIHSAFDCAEPDCYVCGNHRMDERGRCTVPTCRATNTPEVVALVAGLREAPIEYVRGIVGVYFADRLNNALGAAREAGLEEPARVTTPAPAPRDGGHG
jgi:hypothetical protein